MKGRAEVYRRRAQLDQTFKRIDRIDTRELELRSDFAKYLCVLLSGYCEKAIQELAMACCRRMAGGPVLNFALARLDWSSNAHSETVLKLVSAFDASWGDDLQAFLTPERKEALNSVVGLRNVIAHGGHVTVSYAQIREYRDQVEEVIDHLCGVFDPVPPLRS